MTDKFNDAMEQELEMDNIVMLTDEEGNDVPFEFLDLIEYQDGEYVVLLPVDDDETGEVVILQLIQESDDEDTFAGIESEEILNAVFDIFKERYKDQITFVDDE